jgi:hypothetical protein
VAELTQNVGGHNFKENIEVCTSVSREQKRLFQGTINASVLENKICELEE